MTGGGTMEKVISVRTVREIIEELKKLPDLDIPLYFDCPNCGKVNSGSRAVTIAFVLSTKP